MLTIIVYGFLIKYHLTLLTSVVYYTSILKVKTKWKYAELRSLITYVVMMSCGLFCIVQYKTIVQYKPTVQYLYSFLFYFFNENIFD